MSLYLSSRLRNGNLTTATSKPGGRTRPKTLEKAARKSVRPKFRHEDKKLSAYKKARVPFREHPGT